MPAKQPFELHGSLTRRRADVSITMASAIRRRGRRTEGAAMCGRYTQTYETVKLKPRFDLTEIRGEFRPRYNVSPGQDVPVVLQVDAGRVLDHFRWGLVPVWTKALKGAPKPINAKSETVASSALFKRLLTSRRCPVPAVS